MPIYGVPPAYDTMGRPILKPFVNLGHAVNSGPVVDSGPKEKRKRGRPTKGNKNDAKTNNKDHKRNKVQHYVHRLPHSLYIILYSFVGLTKIYFNCFALNKFQCS